MRLRAAGGILPVNAEADEADEASLLCLDSLLCLESLLCLDSLLLPSPPCLHVCTYVRMSVCTYVRMYVRTYVRMSRHTFATHHMHRPMGPRVHGMHAHRSVHALRELLVCTHALLRLPRSQSSAELAPAVHGVRGGGANDAWANAWCEGGSAPAPHTPRNRSVRGRIQRGGCMHGVSR